MVRPLFLPGQEREIRAIQQSVARIRSGALNAAPGRARLAGGGVLPPEEVRSALKKWTLEARSVSPSVRTAVVLVCPRLRSPRQLAPPPRSRSFGREPASLSVQAPDTVFALSTQPHLSGAQALIVVQSDSASLHIALRFHCLISFLFVFSVCSRCHKSGRFHRAISIIDFQKKSPTTGTGFLAPAPNPDLVA